MIEIKDENRKLLHIVYRLFDLKVTKRHEVIDANNFLQLAALNMPKGKTFEPHKHIWKEQNNNKIIAQESWVVIQGSVCVHLYDIDDSHLSDEIIERGDCSLTFEGGHTYTILKDDTIVYEYKTIFVYLVMIIEII